VRRWDESERGRKEEELALFLLASASRQLYERETQGKSRKHASKRTDSFRKSSVGGHVGRKRFRVWSTGASALRVGQGRQELEGIPASSETGRLSRPG